MKRAVVMIILVFYLTGCANVNVHYVDKLPGMNKYFASKVRINLMDGNAVEARNYYTESDTLYWQTDTESEICKSNLSEIVSVEHLHKLQGGLFGGMMGCLPGMAAGALIGVAVTQGFGIGKSAKPPRGDVIIGSTIAGGIAGIIWSGHGFANQARDIYILNYPGGTNEK